MRQVLAILSAVALCVGCRTPESNPLAAFGAATIPPPEIEMPGAGGGTYYQTPGTGTAPAVAPPSNSLPSISVPSGGTTAPQPSIPRPYSFGSLSPAPSTPSFTSDPADREPIRVVEAAPGSARTATAPPRTSTTPSAIQAAPVARDPIRAFNGSPSSSGISPYVPTFGQPPASGGFKSGSFRTGGSVQPAAYHEAVPAFVEQPSNVSGQWRTR
jgi:hypothetical protein